MERDISKKIVSKIPDNLERLSFFPKIWKFRKFSVPFGIPFGPGTRVHAHPGVSPAVRLIVEPWLTVEYTNAALVFSPRTIYRSF